MLEILTKSEGLGKYSEGRRKSHIKKILFGAQALCLPEVLIHVCISFRKFLFFESGLLSGIIQINTGRRIGFTLGEKGKQNSAET